MLENPFWRYSLALYAHMQPWCLRLQDQYGANVNLLLFCCYSGAKGHRLSQQQLAELQQLVSGWDSTVIKPLRDIRRQLSAQVLGADVSAVKKALLATELDIEKQVQQKLYSWWQQQLLSMREPQEKAIVACLNAYFSQCNITEQVSDDLIRLAISVDG